MDFLRIFLAVVTAYSFRPRNLSLINGGYAVIA